MSRRENFLADKDVIPTLKEINALLQSIGIKITGYYIGKLNSTDLENSLILCALNLETNIPYDILYDDAFEDYLNNLRG